MKPILIFPKPDVLARKKVKPFRQETKMPGRARQGIRLNSSFQLIANGFKNGILSEDPAGFSPERTLVLETVGSVDGFYRVARKIPGLEFIQEAIFGDVDPDDDFYIVDKTGSKAADKLKGYVYLTNANQEALNKLLTYWNSYVKQRSYKFPRGLAPLRNLFEHLKTIRYWDTEDRLRETGIIEDWSRRVKEGQDSAPVEIELWYRKYTELRTSKEERLATLLNVLGGRIIKTSVIHEINYHSILADIPIASIGDLLSDNKKEIELLRCDDVMFFRPSGQCMAPIFTVENDQSEHQAREIPSKGIESVIEFPVVALLDGLPLENHEWISDYLIVDDPDGWSDDYSPSDQQHGTSMASLIIRGDMNDDELPIQNKLYCRPILKPGPEDFYGKRRERVPEGELPLDLVHRSVRRIFEGDGQEPPVAPSVKVINLSVADPNRLFDQMMSPWAKLIDYLSTKYGVLFVISAGNHLDDIELGITNKEFSDLSSEEKEKRILEGISQYLHTRRLLSPAESINALTVAAYHSDGHDDDNFLGHINPYLNRSLPSTINPVTWGKKRSVKPEVLLPGGRATYRLKSVLDGDPAVLEILTFNTPPGQKVASPGTIGALNSFAYTFGTSNSAALASRRLCFLYETIQDIYSSSHGEELPKEYESVLLKALICHGASQSVNIAFLENLLKNDKNSRIFNSITAKYLGFGNVDEERIHGCRDNQATIIQCGNIRQDESHAYRFTLPDSLNAQTVERRLIITLAWFSTINPSSSAYREAFLYYRPATGDLSEEEEKISKIGRLSRELDWQMVMNGTVQHEVLTGHQATVFAKGAKMEIVVNCRAQANAKNLEVPYALVVTLDTPGTELPIYEQVKAGLEVQFKSKVEMLHKT
ncbi:MAG: S8 family peptidase [Gammaproteobacteria bacterium]|nr:S8 family peptidase [Gammaproteobacteria bacterium]